MTERKPFKRIGIPEAEALLGRDDVLVLDVRDAAAFGQGRIEGAQNVSIANLAAVIEGTPKTTPVLIYCYRGYASQEYAQILADFRFQDVCSLDGGYEGWSRERHLPGAAATDVPLRGWLAANGFSGGSLDATIANGTTPLMKAALSGEIAIVRALIAAGASLRARNTDGNNALWLACVGAHLDVIGVLIEAGIDIDNRNDNGATVLMYAASTGKAPAVERLIAAGAALTLETLDGFTALDMAATLDCLTLLRRAAKVQPALHLRMSLERTEA